MHHEDTDKTFTTRDVREEALRSKTKALEWPSLVIRAATIIHMIQAREHSTYDVFNRRNDACLHHDNSNGGYINVTGYIPGFGTDP